MAKRPSITSGPSKSSPEDVEQGMTVHRAGMGSSDRTSSTTRGEREAEGPSENQKDRKASAKMKWLCLMILLLGSAASALIAWLGVSAAQNEEDQTFKILALDISRKFETVLSTYKIAALWVYQEGNSRQHTDRGHFRQIYEYLQLSEVSMEMIGYCKNVSHTDRPAAEASMKAYYDSLAMPYGGFVDFDPYTFQIKKAAEKPFYYVCSDGEPLTPTNALFTGIDVYSDPLLKPDIDLAIETHKPVLSGLLFPTEGTGLEELFDPMVVLIHPGGDIPSHPEGNPRRDISLLIIPVPTILRNLAELQRSSTNVKVHLFDQGQARDDRFVQYDNFLGGAQFYKVDDDEEPVQVDLLPPVSMEDARKGSKSGHSRIFETEIVMASRTWSVIICGDDEDYKPDITFVVLGACMIFLACVCLAIWLYTSHRQSRKAVKNEKAAIMLENARQAALREKELNDFVAHECRNPLSAAISATNFVSSAVNQGLTTPESIAAVKEDIHIIDASLTFVNDLLRNMLDIHRPSQKDFDLTMTPVSVYSDIMEPVAAMLYNRGMNFDICVDCPRDLVLVSDKLRLQQIILNLSRNSVKFVTTGFVRLRAEVINDNVTLFVEDSGPGIPQEKRDQLFNKYQKSLDRLSQGTGIGLAVVRKLIDLMGADIYLDDDYDSGVEGFPGARFVIPMNTPPAVVPLHEDEQNDDDEEHPEQSSTSLSTEPDFREIVAPALEPQFPEELSILFVDDDTLLRRLFVRSVRNFQPNWCIREAASGEAALRIVQDEKFDVIFVDQYMASVDQVLLGTETVRAMRAQGVTARLCGLSANNMEKAFVAAGADLFWMKPFPCKKEGLEQIFTQVLGESV